MEKFGIFELLDALSALTAPQNTPAPENPAPQDVSAPENPAPKRHDYLAPPAYAAPAKESEASAQNPFAAFPPSEEKSDAFSAFLARHDEVSRRIDGKKS